jgi:PPIC-type PPIASE domain
MKILFYLVSLSLITSFDLCAQSLTRKSPFSNISAQQSRKAGLPGVAPTMPFRRAKRSERKAEFVYTGNGREVDSILASVNDQPISLTDVMLESGAMESRLSLVYTGKELYNQIWKSRNQVLEDIISRKLLLMDYQKSPFRVPQQYIEQTLDDLALSFGCTSREELVIKARKTDMTIADLRQQAKNKVIMQILISNYYYQHVNLTPRELFEYYEKNHDEFSTPAASRIQLLLLKKGKDNQKKIIKEISADLKDGNPKIFSSLTVLHSDGPNPQKGGDVGWIENAKLRPEFANAIKKIPDTGIVGPIKTLEGVYFIRVTKRRKAYKADYDNLNRELKKKIERKLRMQAYKEYIAKLKKDAIIRYRK